MKFTVQVQVPLNCEFIDSEWEVTVSLRQVAAATVRTGPGPQPPRPRPSVSLKIRADLLTVVILVMLRQNQVQICTLQAVIKTEVRTGAPSFFAERPARYLSRCR